MYKTFKELVEQLNNEDTTLYCELLDNVNTNKLEHYAVRDLYNKLTTEQVKTFTPTQLTMLKIMRFKGGHTVGFYTGYGSTDSPIRIAVQALNTSNIINFNTWGVDDTTLNKEDLKYITLYHRSQWQKANPTLNTKRKVRGTGFVFKMDMFSLTVFKNSIEKEFLRTEAKNLVKEVNKAYKNSPCKQEHIKIRNKFYALILNNTPVQTKALLNELKLTGLWEGRGTTKTYYPLEEDECIALEVYYVSDMVSYMTPSFMNTYSSDLQIVTHNINVGESRDLERRVSGASILLTIYSETGNKAYKTLAARMLSDTTDTSKIIVLNKTKAVQELRNILLKKEDNE